MVNVNVALPAETPVTTPPFVTVATAPLLLAHVPPVVGDNVVVPFTQMDELPVILTTGNALIVKVGDAPVPVLPSKAGLTELKDIRYVPGAVAAGIVTVPVIPVLLEPFPPKV